MPLAAGGALVAVKRGVVNRSGKVRTALHISILILTSVCVMGYICFILYIVE
jgi:hypothetical protein